MRKIYMLLAASAVIFSASAAEITSGKSLRTQILPKNKVEGVFKARMNKTMGSNVVVKGMRKADGNTSLEGTWTFVFGDFYFEESTFDYITGQVTSTVENGIVSFTDESGEFLPFNATFNEENSTLEFTRDYIGQESGYYMFQEPYQYDWDLEDIVDIDALVGDYDSSYGTLYFNEDQGLAWVAYQTPLSPTGAGYFDILDFVSASLEGAGPSLEGEWKPIGKATLIDGWLVPALGVDQFKNPYEVEMEQSEDNEYIYRLVNPYQAGPVADYNANTKGGYIVFDVSDPDHVLFLTADAGFSNTQLGITQFFAYNALGSLMAEGAYTSVKDAIAAETGYIPFTTYKDGVVSLNMEEINGEKLNDANFGYQLLPTGGMVWEDQSKNVVDMSARIYFPGVEVNGVEGVEADANADAVYYNLQGIKISNPKAGLPVIKVEGKKASKIIVR